MPRQTTSKMQSTHPMPAVAGSTHSTQLNSKKRRKAKQRNPASFFTGKMPSLRGLGLDGTLQERLLSEGATGASTAAVASSGGGTAIRTSQSLLSRDPQALASQLRASLPEALNIRSSVADAITAQSRVGRDAATIVGGVSLAIRRAAATTVAAGDADPGSGDGVSTNASTGRKRPRTVEPGEAAAVGEEDAATGPSKTLRLFHRRRPPPVGVGAVTALDMCIHTAITSSTNAGGAAACSAVGTGSAALDRLLAPNPDLADDGPANRIYQSLVMPSNVNLGRVGGNKEEERCFGGGEGKSINSTAATRTGGGGIRLGYVTEVYGPSSMGKTQLALDVAARASVQGWTVHYLAGGGGASSLHPLARRLKSLVQHRMEEYVASNGGEVTALAIRKAMDRVGFVAVADGHDALSALAGIDRDIAKAGSNNGNDGNNKSSENNVHKNLIVFDSASGCLSSDLFADGDGGVGSALVEDVAFSLKRMARTVGTLSSPARCAVLAVNGTVSAGVGHKAALGIGWSRAADVQVHFDSRGDELLEYQLEEGRNSGSIPGLNVTSKRVIKATLTKHYGKAISGREDDASTSASIAITRLGISDEN